MTILTALSLIALLVFSHILSFSKLDYILRWLFPVCLSLLIFTIICIIVTLATFSVTRYDDINQLIYSSALLEDVFQNSKFGFLMFRIEIVLLLKKHYLLSGMNIWKKQENINIKRRLDGVLEWKFYLYNSFLSLLFSMS